MFESELSSILVHKKKAPFWSLFTLVAEREGFEPPEVLPSIVFKTTAIDHSAISPKAVAKLSFFLIPQIALMKKSRVYLDIGFLASD